MELRTLGKSGIAASAIGLGCMSMSGVYGQGDDGKGSPNRRGGLGSSAPRVARWLGDIREFFPAPVVQVLPLEGV